MGTSEPEKDGKGTYHRWFTDFPFPDVVIEVEAYYLQTKLLYVYPGDAVNIPYGRL